MKETRSLTASSPIEASLRIRPANQDDMFLYFRWANDTEVRRNSINADSILLENHKQWFYEKLVSGENHFFIFTIETSPVAQIRFDQNDGKFIINFSIDKDYRGKGLGKHVIKQGIDRLISKLGYVPSFYALVREDNSASAKTFLVNNFHHTGNTQIEKNNYFIFTK